MLCDQIDQLIYSYDTGETEAEEHLQNALVILEDVLDDSSDTQGSSQEIFKILSSFCAHDLERFIFDFISDQIEEGNLAYASELIDAFEEYVEEKRRFEFLRARVIMHADVQEGNLVLERILDVLTEEPDLELLLTIAESLVRRGDIRLFMLSIRLSVALIKSEEQFQEILRLVAEYFRCLDREEEERSVLQFLQARSAIALHLPIQTSDLSQFSQILKRLFTLPTTQEE